MEIETYVVLLTELLAEGSAHDDTALAGGSLEVSGAALAAGSRDVCRLVLLAYSVAFFVFVFNSKNNPGMERTVGDLGHCVGCG